MSTREVAAGLAALSLAIVGAAWLVTSAMAEPTETPVPKPDQDRGSLNSSLGF